MKIEDLKDSKYVKVSELMGRDVTVTIDYVSKEVVGTGEDAQTKAVIYFKDAKKPFVCNITNAQFIATSYGEETDNWPGCKITLYPTKTTFGGKMVDCIRVRTAAEMSQKVGRPAQRPTVKPVPVEDDGPPLEDTTDYSKPSGGDNIPF